MNPVVGGAGKSVAKQSAPQRSDSDATRSRRKRKDPVLELVLCSLCEKEIFVDVDKHAALNFNSTHRNICGSCRRLLQQNDSDGNQAKVQRLEDIGATLQTLFGALQLQNEELQSRGPESVTRQYSAHHPDDVTSFRDGVSVPQIDLGRHNFGSALFHELSDRQLFSWALETETRVRFSKLQHRTTTPPNEPGIARRTASGGGTSLLGPSGHLIDIYPVTPAMNKKLSTSSSNMEKVLFKYNRKAVSYLRTCKVPDGSLTPIEVDENHDVDYEHLGHLKNDTHALPVPPNFLFFEICLEGYLGYNPKHSAIFHSSDSAMPRAAVMGGAVVAALSAWREIANPDPWWSKHSDNKPLRDRFHRLENVLKKADLYDDSDLDLLFGEYVPVKRDLVIEINNHFLRNEGVTYSKFDDGDVDFFLQPSPMTKSIAGKLCQDEGITKKISKYLGGSGYGFCHDDLHRFAKQLLGNLKNQTSGSNADLCGDFVYALSKNGLSFIYGPTMYSKEREDERIELIQPWPRPTQLIMLHPDADLLGALMDFDLSVAGCAYDGVSVYATPRAALSLSLRVNVITPFCFEEKRNQKRVVKYFKRGFDPYIIDQNCRHKHPCSAVTANISKYQANDAAFTKGGQWKSSSFRTEEEYKSILDRQRIALKDGESLERCCNKPNSNTCEYSSIRYTMALFEESPAHSIEFFRKLHNWDQAFYDRVLKVPVHLRIACKLCRIRYGTHLFLKSESPLEQHSDLLRSEKTFMKTDGHSFAPRFQPTFYAGPAFDSTKVREDARSYEEIMSTLGSQLYAEETRFLIKHNGRREGYMPRFFVFQTTITSTGLESGDRVGL